MDGIANKTKEISVLLDYICNEENIPQIRSNPEICDGLKMLQKEIGKILKKSNSQETPKVKKIQNGKSYGTTEIEGIFSKYTSDQIKEKYTLEDLRSMYTAIYGEKPSSSKSKKFIVNAIGQYYGASNRAKAFFE